MKHRWVVVIVSAASMLACTEATNESPPSKPPSSEALPAEPASFRIELSGSACHGTCPVYTVAIDQDGQVSFAGERCTAQLGVSNKSVPEADARAVYDALRSTAFASLKDRYLTMEDGCDRVATDHPTSTWTVEADGFEKSMERYHGCDGPAALDEVDAVETVLHMRAAIRAWLEPPLSNCD